MNMEKAILAGGCFWGVEELIRNYPGVISTVVGYTGGDVPHATYRNHGTHAEAIEIVFDPSRLSYRKLLEFFFQIHDPTTRNRQGNDKGTSYRSAIFYLDATQKEAAVKEEEEEALRRKMEAGKAKPPVRLTKREMMLVAENHKAKKGRLVTAAAGAIKR